MGTIPNKTFKPRAEIGTIDMGLDICMGSYEGISGINKFGRNIEIDSGVTADIWDGGHTVASGGVSLIWVAPTQARAHNIVSSSTSDDGDPVGVGARTIQIYGLTSWDSEEVSEVITMNGTSNVATTNSYVIIYRMKVLTKGATSANVGIIKATAVTDNTITAQIRAGQGQTQMAIYAIPSTQKLYIGRLYANCNKAAGNAALMDTSLLVNPEPDAELTNFITKHTFGLQTVGTSAFTIPYYIPKLIEGPAIVKVQCLSGTNDMDVSAGFDAVVVNNS